MPAAVDINARGLSGLISQRLESAANGTDQLYLGVEGNLEKHELAAQGGLVHVHEGGQLGQRDGRVQLEQLLEGGQVLLLLHHALEAPQLQPVRFLRQHSMGSDAFKDPGTL